MAFRFITLFLVLLMAHSAKAQDTLYNRNGSKLVVKVLEISKENVKYQRYTNPDGPVYIVSKSDINKIAYPNGDVDVFMPMPRSSAPDTSEVSKQQSSHNVFSNYQHHISMNVFDLIFGVVTFQFETNLKSGNSSIRVPLSTGLNTFSSFSSGISLSDFNYYSSFKTISTGIDYRYFPKGTGHNGAYVGPSLCFGVVSFRYSNSYHGISYTEQFSGLGVAFGYQFYTTPRLNINLGGAAGLEVYRVTTSYVKGLGYRPLARIDVSMGWRFGASREAKK